MSIPGAASPLFIGAAAADAAEFQIDRSLRFERADDAYLSKTFSAGNRKTWTFSCWAKLSEVDTNRELFCTPGANPWITLQIASNNKFAVYWTAGQAGTPWTSDALFRDPSAWYHFVVAWDTTQSTASNRLKVYANGVQLTGSNNYPDYDTDYQVNSAVQHGIGGNKDELGGYLAEIHFVDGAALAATDFGEEDSNGVWQPKQFTGSYSATVAAGYTGTVPTSTSDVPPAGSYGNGIATAAVLFGGTLLTNGQNHIRQDGGGIEWSAAIPLSSGDVAGAQCLYFNNTSAHTIQFKINGSWVDVQQNAQNVIGSTQGQGALITYTASGSVNWTGVKATGGSNVSVTTVAGIFVNGNLVGENDLVGVNGFYLKFADNSSVAALGTDSSGNNNTWTVNNISVTNIDYVAQGSYTASQWDSTNKIDHIFDGFDSTLAYRPNSAGAGTSTFTFGTTVTVTSSLQIRGWKGDSNERIFANGVDISSHFNTQSGGGLSTQNVTSTVGSTPFTLTSVGSENQNNRAGAIAKIIVDGTTLVSEGAQVIDSLIDTPTDYTANSGNNGGNYCTLNPLTKTVATLSQGNLFYDSHSSTQHCVGSTFAVASGKWYWEYTIESSGTYHYAGIADVDTDYTDNWCGSSSGWSVSVNGGGNISYNNTENHGSIGTSASSGQTWGWALDMDNGTLKVYVNGSIGYSGNSIIPSGTSLTGRTVTPAVGHSNHKDLSFNFGQRPFKYTPPANHLSLCSTNLTDPTITDSSTAFVAKTFTANASNQTISTNFSPDLVWVKSRANSYGNELYDIVRGTNRRLTVNTSANEQNIANQLTAFNTDGFTLGSASSSNYTNNTASIAWAWDAGTSTVSNTDGDITTSLRVNQSTGVSIAKYYFNNSNGHQTLGHGLGVIPDVVIRKDTDVGDPWSVYSKKIGFTQRGYLSGTDGWSGTTTFSSASATSTVNRAHNMNSGNYVDWSFAAISGFSGFGTYEGNGSTDGPFVQLSFQPALIIIKNIDNVGTGYEWFMFDTARDTFNVAENILKANEANAETDSDSLDIVSNGFKIRTTTNGLNLNNHTHIYLAFAQNPFKAARAR